MTPASVYLEALTNNTPTDHLVPTPGLAWCLARSPQNQQRLTLTDVLAMRADPNNTAQKLRRRFIPNILAIVEATDTDQRHRLSDWAWSPQPPGASRLVQWLLARVVQASLPPTQDRAALCDLAMHLEVLAAELSTPTIADLEARALALDPSLCSPGEAARVLELQLGILRGRL